MNIVETVAPVPIDDLKKYFADKETFYLIDYTNSQLKGSKLLTYLSNLEIPCDIKFNSFDEVKELLKEYLTFTMIVDIPSLESIMINVLAEHRFGAKQYESFIKENIEAIEKWSSKIDSCTLYNMYMIDEFKPFVENYELNETNSTEGINFVSLLKHPECYVLYESINENNLKFYKSYFTEYMFKGKNLYSFWANNNNPMFLLTFGIAENLFTSNEYIEAQKNTIKELTNAASI